MEEFVSIKGDMMNIVIEPAAREYIQKKNADKAITISLAQRPGGCCGGGCVCDAQLPTVRLGIDQGKVNSYQKTMVDGINVYYSDRLLGNYKTVTVKIEKILFINNLAVTGKSS